MDVSGQFHAVAALPQRKRAPGIHWIGGWVGPRAGAEPVMRRKIRRESNPVHTMCKFINFLNYFILSHQYQQTLCILLIYIYLFIYFVLFYNFHGTITQNPEVRMNLCDGKYETKTALMFF
jgi:hypothetical protein